ncbi:arsenate reductase [Lishizhenia tianjinensis]|uniref:Arsenate reductase n=1 Tax=Lishizhenia tianjinensis TaxID=477690 RepID=A0A1I7AHQ8_9FLAO|nr:hypothetical protein [Lishizhenia tianjinensis]SFT74511.1 arsenate reductase [Lishizhenia tianjinensis]
MFEKIEQLIKTLANKEVKSTDLLDFLLAHQAGENHLVFVCTHNSRRSQFGQVWAHVLAHHFQLNIKAYSAGTEVTECNPRTLQALHAQGFEILSEEGENPVHKVYFSKEADPILLWSKTIEDDSLPQANFVALMTCDHADENCPFIPGAQARIPYRYEDPKAFDGTDLEAKMYQERSLEIATDLHALFSQLSNK